MATHIADRDIGTSGQGQRVVGAGVYNRANTGGAGTGDSHDDLTAILQTDSISSRGSFNGDASENMGGNGRISDDGGAIGFLGENESALINRNAGIDR